MLINSSYQNNSFLCKRLLGLYRSLGILWCFSLKAPAQMHCGGLILYHVLRVFLLIMMLHILKVIHNGIQHPQNMMLMLHRWMRRLALLKSNGFSNSIMDYYYYLCIKMYFLHSIELYSLLHLKMHSNIIWDKLCSYYYQSISLPSSGHYSPYCKLINTNSTAVTINPADIHMRLFKSSCFRHLDKDWTNPEVLRYKTSYIRDQIFSFLNGSCGDTDYVCRHKKCLSLSQRNTIRCNCYICLTKII